jgi:hypothetical protein
MFKYKDLEYVLLPYAEIGMYEPKSGTSTEMVVFNFYTKEEEVLKELKTFISYMPIDSLVDVSSSDYSDTEGRYIVYVELFLNKDTWMDMMRIILELGMSSGLDNWKVKIYKKESKKINIDDLKKLFEKDE